LCGWKEEIRQIPKKNKKIKKINGEGKFDNKKVRRGKEKGRERERERRETKSSDKK